MLLPANSEKMSDSELVDALVGLGYSEDAAEYLVGKIRGTIEDENQIV